MKNECSIVRDILPLYLENMVSDETGAIVKEHLKNCSECAAELEVLKTGTKVEKVGSEMRDNLEVEVVKTMKATRKKFPQAVLRLADQAFNDVQHTGAENEQNYGLPTLGKTKAGFGSITRLKHSITMTVLPTEVATFLLFGR